MFKSQLYYLVMLPLLISAQLNGYFSARVGPNHEVRSRDELENGICGHGEGTFMCPIATMPGGLFDSETSINVQATTIISVTLTELATTTTTELIGSSDAQLAQLNTTSIASDTASTSDAVTFLPTSTFEEKSTVVLLTTITLSGPPSGLWISDAAPASGSETNTATLVPPSPISSQSGAGMANLDRKLLAMGMIVFAGMLFQAILFAVIA